MVGYVNMLLAHGARNETKMETAAARVARPPHVSPNRVGASLAVFLLQ
jgi:hypothetical protein